jgi:hypothetical protein
VSAPRRGSRRTQTQPEGQAARCSESLWHPPRALPVACEHGEAIVYCRASDLPATLCPVEEQ